MANTKWRDEFFHMCGWHGMPVDAARKILRHANTVQRAAEVDCSVSDPAARAYWSARSDRAEKSIREIVSEIASAGMIRAEFSGDPRGCVVKLVGSRVCGVGALRGISDVWTISVPGFGFTGAQIDRLTK